jgi:hypothetical protein
VATPAGSQALRIPRYGIQKFNVSRCFNDFQGFSMIFNVCFTCTRWHVKVSGSFMFSWNYWLMMGMSYAKYNGERSKLESLRVGKRKAKKKDVGAEKA